MAFLTLLNELVEDFFFFFPKSGETCRLLKKLRTITGAGKARFRTTAPSFILPAAGALS